MTPFEASNDKLISSNNNHTAKLASHTEGAWRNNNNLPKIQVRDYDRVPYKKNIYSKAYTTNWNRELFKIQKKPN